MPPSPPPSAAIPQGLRDRLGELRTAVTEFFAGGWTWNRVLGLLAFLAVLLGLWKLGGLLWQILEHRRFGRSGSRRYAERCRRRASRLLKRFQPAYERWAHELPPSNPARDRWRETYDALLRVRFGDLAHLADPDATLEQARDLLRHPQRETPIGV